jgi:hypothetical protein
MYFVYCSNVSGHSDLRLDVYYHFSASHCLLLMQGELTYYVTKPVLPVLYVLWRSFFNNLISRKHLICILEL